MEIVVNGDALTLESGNRLTDLLAQLGLQDKRLAVERNGEIVPRSTYASQTLAAGDRLEIVQAIGGG